MVDREVDWPVWVVLGRSWGLCVRSWAALGAYVGGLGPLLEPMLAVLGRSWRLCWRSWAALGAYVGGPGPLLGPMLAVLGCSWGLCWRSWAVLGRSWRSWAALGTYVGGPGPSWAEKWPWPEREGDLAGGSGPKSGPGSSGKAVLGRESTSCVFCPPDPRTHFFYRYTCMS